MSSTILTWDDAVPRSPGIDDVGGDQKEDRKGGGNPKTSVMAADVVQWAKQIVAVGKTITRIGISIRFAAGVPTYDGHDSVTSIAQNEITIVDNGTGDTTIKWAKGRIPLPSRKPRSSVNGSSGSYRIAAELFSDATFDGVRVYTSASAGVSDVDFTVEL